MASRLEGVTCPQSRVRLWWGFCAEQSLRTSRSFSAPGAVRRELPPDWRVSVPLASMEEEKYKTYVPGTLDHFGISFVPACFIFHLFCFLTMEIFQIYTKMERLYNEPPLAHHQVSSITKILPHLVHLILSCLF